MRIKRPTIVAGGELTMDLLDVMPGAGKNISEAPLQLKSNGGTLVIDDFGRPTHAPRHASQPVDRSAGEAL